MTHSQLSTIFFRYDNTLDDAGTGGGTQGPQGPMGPQGPQGVPGAPGTPGTNAQVTAQVAIGVIPLPAGSHRGHRSRTITLPSGGDAYDTAPGVAYLIQMYGAFQIPNGDGGPVECDLFGVVPRCGPSSRSG